MNEFILISLYYIIVSADGATKKMQNFKVDLSVLSFEIYSYVLQMD